MDLRMRQYVSSLAAIGLLVGATNAYSNSVTAEAFGISVNAAGVRVGPTPHVRSEERRVGKECRSRWSPYH